MVRIAGFHPADPGSSPGVGIRYRVRVVKEIDLKSIGLCPRRFEPCRCRFIYLILIIDYWIQNLKLSWFVDYRGKVVYKVVFPSLVKGVRLKIACYTLRGFKSHPMHVLVTQLVRVLVL